MSRTTFFLAICCCLLVACAAQPRGPRVVFDKTSPFARVLVVDDGPRRTLRFGSLDGAEQSAIVRDQLSDLPIEYVRYALLGLAHHGQVRRLLMVGLGGGTFTTLVHRVLPEIAIDAVEIDPVVVEVARTYFGLREDDRYRVHVADASVWIAQPGATFDLVFLDGYAGDDVAPVLASEAFFRAVRGRLAPGGVVAINLAEMTGATRSAERAFRAVFTPFDCRRTPLDGNVVLFAAAGPRRPDPEAVLRWAVDWDARGVTTFSMRAVAAIRPCLDRPTKNKVGTPTAGPDR